MLYGILSFALHKTSRREANRTLTRPMVVENLKLLFPDLETIPHRDTVYRLLERIDVNEIGAAQLELVQRFIRNKKFRRFLIANCYLIAIDGSQKLARNVQWSEETLQREVNRSSDREATPRGSLPAPLVLGGALSRAWRDPVNCPRS